MQLKRTSGELWKGRMGCNFMELITLSSPGYHETTLSLLSWYLTHWPVPSPQSLSAGGPQGLVLPFLLFSLYTFSIGEWLLPLEQFTIPWDWPMRGRERDSLTSFNHYNVFPTSDIGSDLQTEKDRQWWVNRTRTLHWGASWDMWWFARLVSKIKYVFAWEA